KLGPARLWIRPPGFAHPSNIQVGTSPDERTERSYPTRAKLDAPTPGPDEGWTKISDRVRTLHSRDPLLVTNTGPRDEGYNYCTFCGLIEAAVTRKPTTGTAHAKPYPDSKDPNCPGGRTARSICLGTEFITDVQLFSLRVEAPLRLLPGMLATEIALRTLSEAIAKATAAILQLEVNEVQG